jgi:hypothetical protein
MNIAKGSRSEASRRNAPRREPAGVRKGAQNIRGMRKVRGEGGETYYLVYIYNDDVWQGREMNEKSSEKK